MVKREDRERLASYIVGTCQSIFMCLEILELEEGHDWEDELLTENVEQCHGCGWWHYSYELEDHDGWAYCDSCAPVESDE
uniref:Uncharacterized protein n=1 Tax=Rhizobium phage IG49 TaxID=3129228 RepID=A0AAU8HZD7_9CAUD